MLGQACLGLLVPPGMGKTSTVLSAFKILKAKGLVNRMLVIAPLRVAYGVWPLEVEKWSEFEHLKTAVVHGKDKAKLLLSDADIFIINPEAVPWLLNYKRINNRIVTDTICLDIMGVDMLCIDESTRFKNGASQRSRALKRHIDYFKRRLILTGTVAPNGLMDLFGQIYILDGGAALGRYVTHYRNAYFTSSGYGGYTWMPQADAMDRIVERIAPITMSLDIEDWLEMPELVNINVEIDLPAEARRVYEDLKDEFYVLLGEAEITAPSVAAAGIKCRQVINGALYGHPLPHRPSTKEVHHIHDVKMNALESLVEELNGHPILLLYEFDHDAQRIQAKFKCPTFTGLTGTKLTTLIHKFNTGQVPIVMGHPDSMGHGLNLQGTCHHVIWFGLTWNLEHYDQAIRRVYRQGQQADKVFVYHIVARNTSDQKVMRVLHDKEHNQSMLGTALREARISL